MKLVAALILAAVAVLAFFMLLLGALGVGFGVRAGGNLFAEEGFGFLRPAYLVPLILAAGALSIYCVVAGTARPKIFAGVLCA